MTDLSDFAQVAAGDHNLCVVSTLRADGTIQASVVNAGVLDGSPTGAPVVAFVAHGGSQKLLNLRVRPVTTIVARANLAWVAVEGTAVLCGPDDPFPGVDPDGIRLLLREIFTAAGGTHDDWDTYDRVMAEERRTAVLVAPRRLCVDSGNEGHALRRRVF
jgi:PPOX class probable F420-dependent enzyme